MDGAYGWIGGIDPAKAPLYEGLARARDAGFEVVGPFDAGPPVGYWGIIADPDGHNLEVSFGQSVEFLRHIGPFISNGGNRLIAVGK